MQRTITWLIAVIALSACDEDGAAASDDVAAPPSNVPAKLDNAGVSMGEISSGGLTAKDMTCTGKGGNAAALFGGLGGLGSQKDAIQACADKPMRPRVHWKLDNERVTDVRVADAPTPKVARCIADAIGKVSEDLELTCVATLVLGE